MPVLRFVGGVFFLPLGMLSRDSAHEIMEAGIGAQRIEPGVYLQNEHPMRTLLIRLSQIFQGGFVIAESHVDEPLFISGNVTPGGQCVEFGEDLLRTAAIAGDRQQMAQGCEHHAPAAGKVDSPQEIPLCLNVHVLLLKRLCSHEIRLAKIWIEFQTLPRLRNDFVVTMQEQIQKLHMRAHLRINGAQIVSQLAFGNRFFTPAYRQ